MLPYLREHGSELLRDGIGSERVQVGVARARLGDAGHWLAIDVDVVVEEPAEYGVRYIAALAFEVLTEGTVFIDGGSGPKAWPRAERKRELRDWILRPPPEATDFIVPPADYDHASLRVEVGRELGDDDIDYLRRVLASKWVARDGGIPRRGPGWDTRHGSTTICIMFYRFRYWEPGDPHWEGFDQWWLAAECMEAWTGGTVAWCAGHGVEMMKFDTGTRAEMLQRWPLQHIDNIRRHLRDPQEVERYWGMPPDRQRSIFYFGDGRGSPHPVDVISVQENGVRVRFLAHPRREEEVPYYRIRRYG
jgi:hypothetical protein